MAPRIFRRTRRVTLNQDIIVATAMKAWWQANPQLPFRWLDVCCGEGDILETLPTLIGADNVKRVEYSGYELQHLFVRKCKKRVLELRLAGEVITGQLDKFSPHFQQKHGTFSCVSLINSLHELPNTQVSRLLLDMISCCAVGGFVYVFDLAALRFHEPELGATPWKYQDIAELLSVLSKQLGVGNPPVVSQIADKAWFFQLYKAPEMDDAIRQNADKIVKRLDDVVERTLTDRRKRTSFYLEELAERQYDCSMEQINDDDSGSEIGRRQSTADLSLQELIDINVRDCWAFDRGASHFTKRTTHRR